MLKYMHTHTQVDSLNDRRDFDSVRNAMRVLGYSNDEIETIWMLLAAILHLVSGCGNLTKLCLQCSETD